MEDKNKEITITSDGDRVIALAGPLTVATAAAALRAGRQAVARAGGGGVTLDLAGVSALDDYGVTVLLGLERLAAGPLTVRGASEAVAAGLERYGYDELRRRPPAGRARRPRANPLVTLGAATLRHLADMAFMAQFLGATVENVGRFLARPRSLRWDDCVLTMQRVGVDALPIVGLISFLLGLIMAFMSSVQLQQFGANIYVASLVGLAMTRELGPIMTAIIVAGRSGSAFAAEIGTMRLNEEIDALEVMGFDPLRFLCLPKLVASLLTVPMLTLFSDLFAIVGGMVVGIGMLDLTVHSYVSQTIRTLDLFDVFWGVGKSMVFAALVAWIGCLRGFQVRGGADAVGRATTSAVVSAIFLIILADSIFSVILRYWE